MSQRDIQELLLELGGEASSSDISNLASKRYPTRSLDQYISNRLESMKRKGLVEKLEENRWRLTQKGEEISLETSIEELDSIYINKFTEIGISISNLVATLDLNSEFDLVSLASGLPNSDYHPEQYPSLIYSPKRDSSITFLLPASGRISIVGATSKEEIISEVEDLINELHGLGISLSVSTSDILIQNIVANYDFGREFDLAAISVALGLESTEYDPENFPGIIYRSKQNTTALLFRTGKCVLTGSKSYPQVMSALREITQNMQNSGVKLSDTEAIID
jgi:transcription initiation factor TFIID TATA-box-binding protein